MLGVALFTDTIFKILEKFGWDYKSSLVRLVFDSLSATRGRLSSVQKHTYDKDSFYCYVHRLNYEHILNLVYIDVATYLPEAAFHNTWRNIGILHFLQTTKQMQTRKPK